MSAKNRFTTTDVKCMVRDIRSSILGQRVANIYDLTDKIYLFKFAIPGISKKIFLLLESGMRFHTTKYKRDKSDMPSPFAMKLRKHIRLKRLEDIRQLGSDRVVDMKFGSGEIVCHIILELYASGNIVLTDGSYEVLALLRSHQFEDDVAVKVGEIYPIAFTTTVTAPSTTGELTDSTSDIPILNMSVDKFYAWAQDRQVEVLAQNQAAQQLAEAQAAAGQSKKSSKKYRSKKMSMRQLLLCKESGAAVYGPEIIDHCLLTAGLSPSGKVDELEIISPEGQGKILSLINELTNSAPQLLALLDTPGQPGYLLGKEKDGVVGDLTDFVPRRFRQHDGEKYLECSSFDEAVDEYFCRIEEQRLQHQASSAEEAAKRKVEKVKGEMSNQLKGLADLQTKMEQSAGLTEAFAEDVDKALLVINSALTAQFSWDDIAAMVAAETAAGNPIAALIVKLKLDKNRVVMRLPDIFADSDDDDDDDSDDEKEKNLKYVEVEYDLALSAYANASQLYSKRKVAKGKELKTSVAAERAIKAAEVSSEKQLAKQQTKRNLQASRKVHWFEKFNWFITSEGYLVLSGRDAQQNEQLVKKYLRPGDAYVHADMHGASSCIVRCKTSKDPVTGSETPLPLSPFALSEAGTMTICRSGAWAVKVVMSAWWVHANQVSKTAPSGEYLSTGSFMIYGKKKFLAPSSLEMGFGILFRLDDGSVSRHLGDRKERSVDILREDEDHLSRYGITSASTTADSGAPGLSASVQQQQQYQTQDNLSTKGGDKVKKRKEQKDMGTGSGSGITVKEMEKESVNVKNVNEHDEGEDDDENEDANGTITGTVPANARLLEDEEEVTPETETEKSSSSSCSNINPVPVTEPHASDDIYQHAGNSSSIGSGSKGVGKLSAYQRKMLKKGKTLEEIEAIQREKEKEAKKKEEEKERGKERREDEEVPDGVAEEQEKESSNKDKKDGRKGGGGKGWKDDTNTSTNTDSNYNSNNAGAGIAKKTRKLSKKKARRYADQDEEDVLLAMLALGHKQSAAGGGLGSLGGDGFAAAEETTGQSKQAQEKLRKQTKAGVHLLQEDWEVSLLKLSDEVRDALLAYVEQGKMKAGEIDTFEISTLATFSTAHGLEILANFGESDNLQRIGNKSGFLAGIMRRYSKAAMKVTVSSSSVTVANDGDGNGDAKVHVNQSDSKGDSEGDSNDEGENKSESRAADNRNSNGKITGTLSRRERKKQEQQEIQSILEEEGMLEEDEGKQADELEKLTGTPLLEDVLLYAVPMCAPYSAMKNMKYKVKITPGTIKKGKACKNAIEVFTNAGNKERTSTCLPHERTLMKALTDPEMVAIMIGDVKLSMPGLYSTLKKKKAASKKGKVEHNHKDLY